MTSYQQIKDDIVLRMKAKAKFELGVLRLVASKIEKNGDKSEEGVMAAIKSELKEMNQTLEALERIADTEGAKANVEAQKARIAFLEQYLPPQMSNAEIRAIVQDVIKNLGNEANMTLVMKGFKEELAYNGSDVNMGEVVRIVLEELEK